MENEKNQTRSQEEAYLDISATENFNSPQYSMFLDQLFTIGSIPEETFKIFGGLIVTLRILAPIENIEVAKIVDASPGFYAKDALIKLETLARAISKVNGQYLRFSDAGLAEWQTFRNTTEKPTEVSQQRHILHYKFQQIVIEEIYKKYQELLKKQDEVIVNLKKN